MVLHHHDNDVIDLAEPWAAGGVTRSEPEHAARVANTGEEEAVVPVVPIDAHSGFQCARASAPWKPDPSTYVVEPALRWLVLVLVLKSIPDFQESSAWVAVCPGAPGWVRRSMFPTITPRSSRRSDALILSEPLPPANQRDGVITKMNRGLRLIATFDELVVDR